MKSFKEKLTETREVPLWYLWFSIIVSIMVIIGVFIH